MNLEIWSPKNLKLIRMQIRSAQNIGKVLISRVKSVPASFGAIFDELFQGLQTYVRSLVVQ